MSSLLTRIPGTTGGTDRGSQLPLGLGSMGALALITSYSCLHLAEEASSSQGSPRLPRPHSTEVLFSWEMGPRSREEYGHPC